MRVERHQVARALRAAASALAARGPQSPQAIYRYGSRPNQAEVMHLLREFLEVYAQAGNDLLESRDPAESVRHLEALAAEVGANLDELVEAVRAQT